MVQCCIDGISRLEAGGRARCLQHRMFARSALCRDLDNSAKPLFEAKGHRGIVNAVAGIGGLGVGHGAPELVSGGADGCVKVRARRLR